MEHREANAIAFAKADALIAEADAMVPEFMKFEHGCNCWGGNRLKNKMDELRKAAWRIEGKQKYGPPRPNTQLFDMFLVAA